MQKKLEDVISGVILSIGIPGCIVGAKYLAEAVKLTIEKPELKFSITKGLYKELAEKFQAKPGSIERGIRHAVDVSFNKSKIIELNKIFNIKIYTPNERPCNSELIALLAERIPYLMKNKTA